MLRGGDEYINSRKLEYINKVQNLIIGAVQKHIVDTIIDSQPEEPMDDEVWQEHVPQPRSLNMTSFEQNIFREREAHPTERIPSHNTRSIYDLAKSELEKYLAASPHNNVFSETSVVCDIPKWMAKFGQYQYKLICRAMARFFGVPTSSAGIENDFYFSSLLLNKQRMSMGSELIEMTHMTDRNRDLIDLVQVNALTVAAAKLARPTFCGDAYLSEIYPEEDLDCNEFDFSDDEMQMSSGEEDDNDRGQEWHNEDHRRQDHNNQEDRRRQEEKKRRLEKFTREEKQRRKNAKEEDQRRKNVNLEKKRQMEARKEQVRKQQEYDDEKHEKEKAEGERLQFVHDQRQAEEHKHEDEDRILQEQAIRAKEQEDRIKKDQADRAKEQEDRFVQDQANRLKDQQNRAKQQEELFAQDQANRAKQHEHLKQQEDANRAQQEKRVMQEKTNHAQQAKDEKSQCTFSYENKHLPNHRETLHFRQVDNAQERRDKVEDRQKQNRSELIQQRRYNLAQELKTINRRIDLPRLTGSGESEYDDNQSFDERETEEFFSDSL